MHPDDKRRFLERAQRALHRHKTLAEQKRIKERARQRRAGRRKGRRVRWRPEHDEELEESPARESMRAGKAVPAPASPIEPERAARAPLEAGVVVSLARTRVRLATPGGELEAVFPPGLGPAVGDRVGFERAGAELAVVRRIEPRTSFLARPDPAHPERMLVLAANVERVLCVVAAREPRWKPGFVERVLLAAEAGGARVSLVVNKVDLLTPDERRALQGELACFAASVEERLLVSAVAGEGLAELVRATAGRTCVLVGPSGAGKSSLLNALDPGRGRATAAVRASDGKGRHTTTAAELVTLANGARVIDTPGLRQVGLAGLDRRAVEAAFPELRAFARGCRFRDCTHAVEPDCAVREALAQGRIASERFGRYLRLVAEGEAE